jgi:hypothetical protein
MPRLSARRQEETSLSDWLKEASANGDLHVFRISSPPVEVYYRKGKKKFEHEFDIPSHD